jgi:hemerythrin
MEVSTFLSNWLKHHINEVDMGYAEFKREKDKK